jgi:bifunctional UDP-N-acetylglucosamine pyrophosphorylase/glucosamine-1-phosphate N-acetyltransferase
MARIVDRENALEWLAPAIDPSLWTALIPAAGRGTRLGFDKPKILFPVGGATILKRLIELLEPVCAEFVFVLSPDGAALVGPEIRRLVGERGRVAIQQSPRGMGDAVASGLTELRTDHMAIVWGDQVALKRASLEFSMRLLEGPLRPEAVCPTLVRKAPYIHFERDACGKITRVLQQREGDVLPAEGESDSGVFFFRRNALRGYMEVLKQDRRSTGARTGEFNFLPIFPLVDSVPERLVTARIMSEEESVGVNSPADAAYLEARRA